MDLRGIAGVVAPNEIRPGLFHLRSDPGGKSCLCLRVALSDEHQQEPQIWDVIFDRKDRHGMFFADARDVEPVVALPPIHVRINPSSLSGHRLSSSLRPGMLAIVGQNAFVRVPGDSVRGIVVNLGTGTAYTSGPPSDWMAFSEWSFVVDDGDKEITLISYTQDSV